MHRKTLSWFGIFTFSLLFLTGCGHEGVLPSPKNSGAFESTNTNIVQNINTTTSSSLTVNTASDNANSSPDVAVPKSLPTSADLEVPFTVQAPDGEWVEPYKEGCEEASALMVDFMYRKKTFTVESAKKAIDKAVEWQKKKFGNHKDLTAEETAEFIREYFGYKKVEVRYDITLDNIKREVLEGRPVIVPAAGRELHNPHFKQPGPIYHMLVVKGYSGKKIITNDPGTKYGADYAYDENIFLNAIHDYNADDILKGREVMIVIFRE